MSDLELQITSDHPWYHTVWEAAQGLMFGKNVSYPTVDVGVTIGGVEEFYRLDSIHEVTSFDRHSIHEVTSFDRRGVQVFSTAWNKVRSHP